MVRVGPLCLLSVTINTTNILLLLYIYYSISTLVGGFWRRLLLAQVGTGLHLLMRAMYVVKNSSLSSGVVVLPVCTVGSLLRVVQHRDDKCAPEISAGLQSAGRSHQK